jgi:hypothetical protein
VSFINYNGFQVVVEKVTKLTSIGINATLVGECQKDKGVADKIAEGAFTTVFTSPEAALTPGMWRRCFQPFNIFWFLVFQMF